MSTKIYDAYRVREGVDIWDLASAIRTEGRRLATAGLRAFYTRVLDADRRPLVVKSPEHVADYEALTAVFETEGPDFRALGEYRRKWVHEIDDERVTADVVRKVLVDRKYKKADDERLLSPIDVSHFVYTEYGAQLGNSDRDEFNLDASVLVLEHENRFYLKVYSDRCAVTGDVLRFLKDEDRPYPGIEDYHYQNQSDWPEGMTEDEWDERRRLWDAVLDDHGYFGPRQMTIDVVSHSGFHRICPWQDMVAEKLYPREPQKEQAS